MRTILNFRHLLERHHLGEGLLAAMLAAQPAVRTDPRRAGVRRVTRRCTGQLRDEGAYRGRRGHGTVSLATTAANVADITQGPRLLHGAETRVWGDAGYAGVARRPEHQGRRVDWQVALRPGQRRRLAPGSAAAQAEQRKASIRAKVEHPFL